MDSATSPQTTTYDSPALSRVARGALCAGCGGCALIAPGKVAMTMQSPGYLRPVQTEQLSDEEERLIRETCPGLGQSVDPMDRTDDPLWGPYVAMRTGYATDPDLRFHASSGGALTAILLHLVNSGRVDAVLHNAADPKVPVANIPVISVDTAGIEAGAGSRYAPSAPLAALADQLNGTRRLAFVGKPCDVAALRALSRHDARISERIPVLISFFCGGVPSQTGAERILDKLGTSLPETTAFRYRGHGWPGHATATLADGSTRAMSYHDSWGHILSHHVQHRCKICADGSGVAADIVCADAWESDEKGYPVFDERDGTSLIVSRTGLGESIVTEAEQAGILQTEAFDVAVLASIQTGQAFRRRSLLARLAGLTLTARPIPRYEGLHLRRTAMQNKIAVNLRNFLGMVRRVLQGRVG